jgi:dihydroflavonol-4-reductase
MKAFVTGSTGFVGSNLVQALVEQGYTVKALARSSEKAAALLPKGTTIVAGDMEDVSGFADEMKGCDVLFHTAAYFTEFFDLGDHAAKLEAINVRGTITLLDAAEQAGIQKMIYVSSAGVIGNKPDGSPGDETTEPGPASYRNPYFHSKVRAERAVKEWLQTHTLPVVMILPTAIFGPNDPGPTGANRIVGSFLAGRLPAIPPGRTLVVDVRDVVQAMLNAVERGRSGERYIVHSRAISMSDLADLLEQISGKSAPRMRLSYPAALLLAYTSEFAGRLTGTKPMLTRFELMSLRAESDIRTDKAQRELGLRYHAFEDTLRDEVAWFHSTWSESAPSILRSQSSNLSTD